jgi:hypothetical protein
MARAEWIKDPDAVLDYKFDWAPLTNGVTGAASDWLDTDDGEIIVATYDVTLGTAVRVDPACSTTDASTLVIDSDSRTDTNTSVTVWLSAGTAGWDYPVICHIVTDNATPREDDRTVWIKVRER